MDNCGLKLYSDDTAGKLQASVNMCTRLCSVNALTINIKRTKNMAFFISHRVKKCKKASINIDNVKLQPGPSFKYLGLILDSTVNSNHHISSMMRTVLHKMTLLAKIKKNLNDNVATTIYKSMLLAYFEYADVIF